MTNYTWPNIDKIAKLVQEAIDSWPQLDSDQYISGADLVDWFSDWRERAKAALKAEYHD